MVSAIAWKASIPLTVMVSIPANTVLVGSTPVDETPIYTLVTDLNAKPKRQGISAEGRAKCEGWKADLVINLATRLFIHERIESVTVFAVDGRTINLKSEGLVSALSEVLGQPWSDVYKTAEQLGYKEGGMSALLRTIL